MDELKAEIAKLQSQLEVSQGQLEVSQGQILQLQAELSENLESASAMSQASKKRKLVEWNDILYSLGITCSNVKYLTSPENFMMMNELDKLEMLTIANLQDNFDRICSEVAKVLGMNPLPSPSNMSVEDIPRILNGTIPQNDTDISLNQTTAIVHIQEVKTRLEKCLDNSTEMEATARVLLYVIEAVWELGNITIRMQPSIYKHSVFTDFLFIFGDDKLKAFIEVKRTDISTDLTLLTKSTAEALREAHILSLEEKHDTVLFVLTNSKHWSFGKAEKSGVQIKITKTLFLTSNEPQKIVAMLRHVLKGEWPSSES